MDFDQWLAQYTDNTNGLKQATDELERSLAAATVTVSSPDESVTVTIGPNGGLRDLKFSYRASEHHPAELAALVMKTVARGQRAVAEQVVEAYGPVGGGAGMALLTQYVPEDDEAEPAAPAATSAYDELVAEPPAAPAEPPRPAMPPMAPMSTGLPPAPPAPAPAGASRPRRAQATREEAEEYEERPW